MKFIANIAGIAVALLSAVYLADPVKNIYCTFFGTCSGGFFGFDLSILTWVSLLYIFLVVLLLTGLGHRHKYWWIIFALLPAGIFEVAVNPRYIYIPLLAGIIAWGLGRLANKALWKVAPGMMAKLGA